MLNAARTTTFFQTLLLLSLLVCTVHQMNVHAEKWDDTRIPSADGKLVKTAETLIKPVRAVRDHLPELIASPRRRDYNSKVEAFVEQLAPIVHEALNSVGTHIRVFVIEKIFPEIWQGSLASYTGVNVSQLLHDNKIYNRELAAQQRVPKLQRMKGWVQDKFRRSACLQRLFWPSNHAQSAAAPLTLPGAMPGMFGNPARSTIPPPISSTPDCAGYANAQESQLSTPPTVNRAYQLVSSAVAAVKQQTVAWFSRIHAPIKAYIATNIHNLFIVTAYNDILTYLREKFWWKPKEKAPIATTATGTDTSQAQQQLNDLIKAAAAEEKAAATAPAPRLQRRSLMSWLQSRRAAGTTRAEQQPKLAFWRRMLRSVLNKATIAIHSIVLKDINDVIAKVLLSMRVYLVSILHSAASAISQFVSGRCQLSNSLGVTALVDSAMAKSTYQWVTSKLVAARNLIPTRARDMVSAVPQSCQLLKANAVQQLSSLNVLVAMRLGPHIPSFTTFVQDEIHKNFRPILKRLAHILIKVYPDYITPPIGQAIIREALAADNPLTPTHR